MTGHFHFATPEWFWALLLLPLWWVWRMYRQRAQQGSGAKQGLEQFVDAHLLPYLMASRAKTATEDRASGILRTWPWRSVALGMGIIGMITALAGPRWAYEQIEFYRPDAALMVVLDVSRSMDAEDVQPSRMARARQELTDILDAAQREGIHVGLIGFAAEPHILSPLTSDVRLIKELLHVLNTDLLPVQGSDPLKALELAQKQLEKYQQIQGGQNVHLLLLTDGDLEERWASVQTLADRMELSKDEVTDKMQGMRLHVMAVGTEEGAPIPDKEGYHMATKGGGVHVSKMDEAKLANIAEAGHGELILADYRRQDTETLMQAIAPKVDRQSTSTTIRQWNEGYLYPLMLALLCIGIALL